MARIAIISKYFQIAFRLLALLAIAAAIFWWINEHHHGRAKGTPIPFPNVLLCLISATVAGLICKRYWIEYAMPFVAGVAGALGIFESLSGPYGGVLGFLVGFFILVLPFDRKQPAPPNGDIGPAQREAK